MQALAQHHSMLPTARKPNGAWWAARHYKRAGAPQIRQPDPTVFSTLNDLEALMRSTLGALANFNEDERMILTRQFQWEAEKARAEGVYSPPGLVSVDQFRRVWRKLSVRISEDQAHALFIKFGHDSQGLLPYSMFCTKLLSSPARLLALEPEQKGPYRAGRDASFKGKITYRFCRKPVFPPSNWDGSEAQRSARKPKAGLQLEFVYGYAGKDNTAPNLFWTADNKLVYYVAALGIVYDPDTHTQAFFQGHTDDIKCMAIHPERCIVATGQVASVAAGDRTGRGDPRVCVWDTRDVGSAITTLAFPPAEGNSSRMIVALAFSPNGQRLVVVTGDNRHTVHVYEWRSRALISVGVGHNGQPPMVYGAVWNPHVKGRDERSNMVMAPTMFVTYGVKHMKLWTLMRDHAGKETYNAQMFKFGRLTPSDVLSACFISVDTLVTGTASGELLVWDVEGRRGDIGTCIQVVPAHGPGVKAPSIHDGQMVLQGVRALCLRANDSELVSGGSDGQLMVWDVSMGDLSRMLKTIQFSEVGESTPCSFRSLDSKPGSYDLVAGTNRCEVWEVARADVPEPLVQGHTDDVYRCAWHPRKPHKFATVCDSSNVFLWNARRRQLIAKVNIGLPARGVAFSPNGAHMAVGTAVGVIKVLLVEALTQKVAEMAYAKEDVKELRYSPDGAKLAAGSHDNSIDIFDVSRGYARIARCHGHSSYITHLDWSADSRVLQSNCGAYELLYFDGNTGKQLQQSQRDTLWDGWTCTLGFPVMGIWQAASDGTDVNACSRSFRNPAFIDVDPLAGTDGQLLVTGGDDGRVRLFNYPCVVTDAPNREYVGHCSHVMCVRFAPTNRWVLSVGGRDRATMQWRVLPEAVEDAVLEQPQVDAYQVYAAPRRLDVVSDPLALMAATNATATAQLAARDAAAASAADAARQAELERMRKEGMRTYEVTTVTSDIKGAGCNARVFIVLNGSKRASGELRLENGPDNFARGRTDKFTFSLQELGDIDRVVVGHDGTGSQPRWHLDKVIVVNASEPGSPALTFPCDNWLAKDVGDGLLVRTLRLGTAGPSTRQYTVTVKTSDVKGAGTDANVFCTLFGEKGGKPVNTGPIRLENSSNNFERGQEDAFQITAAIGDLKFIRIGHDNTGLGPSWHLQEVVVSSPGLKDAQFVANRWLATDQGDGQTYCVLYPGADASGDAGAPRKYRVVVYTSDIRGAGTDARVYITLFSANTGLDSGKLLLENSKNNFERGQEDIFFVTSPDLGSVAEVEIEHDNSGVSPGWHCEQVVVIDEATGRRTAFPCDRWLAKDEDDGLIRRRLRAEAPGTGTTCYRVTTYTSDVRGAGTDAGVHVELCGRVGGKEAWGPRVTLDNSKNNFERGQVDTFLLKKHKSLGDLCRLRIGHDNKGACSGWHLDHVEVTDDATGAQYYFPCGRWFDKKEEDGAVERVLEVAARDAHVEKAQYKITVHTSDIKFAGTDANVFIQLHGEMDGKARQTDRVLLSNSKQNFERGQVDVFALTLPNIGDLKRVLIGHDDSGAGSDWHLNMVEVLCVNTGQHCRFYHNGWLSKSEPPYKLEVELFPEGAAKPPLARYTVVTYTSDVRGAGTDANVSCIIFGDKGQTSTAKLENSRQNFERGQRDEFIVESVDVGTITRLQIGHDDQGLASAWHLSHVEVVSQRTGQRAYFLADQWLDKKLGTLTLTLEPSDAKGAKQVYKVSVQTGDVRGAGTDADISIQLLGGSGQSDELKLEGSADNFERNKLDEFKLDLGQKALGDIRQMEIGFASQQTTGGKLGSLFGQCWFLSSVEVVHMNSGARAFFLYDGWLNDKKRRVTLVPGQASESNAYKVVVRTSDIRGAGTDANVKLAIFGEKDGKMVDTGLHRLDNSNQNFERGQVDTFLLKTKDVGELKRVQVCSDGTGLGGSWHLDQVEVTDTARGLTVSFPCGKWLDPADPSSLDQTLLPSGAAGPGNALLQYEVTVFTSDLRGAGTDSNVSIEIWGDKDHTAAMKLETAANNFERGAKDVFKLAAPDVGEVGHVVVRKDAKGLLGTDWHLQSVELWHPALKKRYFFVCSDWLKGACERKLVAGKVPDNGRCTYRVLVRTSDLRGAGTDANVTMTLYGDKGDTGLRRLDSSQNNFERGKVDTFFLEAPDLGRFRSLRIGHDNAGFASAWHPQRVEVVNTHTGEQATFPCGQWLDEKRGLEVVLLPDRDGDGKGDASSGGQALTEYTITVVTSDIRGAGTDSNVFIELFGDKGAVGEQRLDSHANNFERGKQDVFKVQATDVGDVARVVLRVDGVGASPDWHCQQVDVFSAATRKAYFFPCNAWLKREGADTTGLRKELVAGAPDVAGNANYRVTVTTSDLKGAGTDADVYLVIYGDKGETGERKLDNGQNNYERGQVDTFFITAPNVGAIQRIKLRTSGGALSGAWHLAQVQVTSSSTGEVLAFPWGKWFDREHGTEHVMWPDRDNDGAGDVGMTGDLIKYRVTVQTSDVRGASTDANVSIELHGEKGFIGVTRLENSADNFRRGQRDEFEVLGTDIGPLTHVIIGHDNSGLASAWHLEQVEVLHPGLKQTFTFPCRDWLEQGKGAGCKRTLKTGAAAAAGGLVTYRVLVKTSDIRGAGTDADVYITLYGPKGDSGERQIESGANDFRRGALDTFILQVPADLGDIQRIKLRTTGSGIGGAWHVAHVDVISSASNTTFHFPCNAWLDKEHGLERVVWRDGSEGAMPAAPLVDYQITVYTSDLRGAGTDANVFIELIGDKGSVGHTRLESSRNDFERGAVDVFVVQGTDVGDVARVVIGHDNSGAAPSWHCRQVEVLNPATQRTYFFPCDAWLEGDRDVGPDGVRKELIAGGPGGPGAAGSCDYRVEVKTGDVRGAGTDGRVSICVYGQHGDTGLRPLESSRNDFERGRLDVFFFRAPDIGAFSSCRVVCEGSGLGAEWFLDHVTVANSTTGAQARFRYGAWFDANAGWSHLLVPEGGPGATATGAAPASALAAALPAVQVEYEVTVATSDVPGAGTDGEVFLALRGERGAMGEKQLAGPRAAFSRAAVDTFHVAGLDIGRLTEATVRLSASGVGSAWHLATIQVLNKATGDVARFVYNNWLEKNDGHPDGAVTLLEASSEAAKATRTTTEWQVTTQTGTMAGAGTDAPVYVSVWGPAGQLGGAEIYLDTSANNFQRSGLDTFNLTFPADKDCGMPVQRVAVGRGRGGGLGQDWFLDWIQVIDVGRGARYRWRCATWLSDHDGLKKEWTAEAVAAGKQQALTLVEVDLPPGAGPAYATGPPSSSQQAYRLVFTTADALGGGTDGTVRLEIADVAGHRWQPSLPQTPGMYEAGRTDDVFVTCNEPLGELVSARVWVEGGGLLGRWRLDSITVTHVASGRRWRFLSKGWVSQEPVVLPATIDHDAPLKSEAGAPTAAAEVARAVEVVAAAAPQAPQPAPAPPSVASPKMVQYDVVIHTGSNMGAGTDANVSFLLTGSQGQARHTLPRDPGGERQAAGGGGFSRGAAARFTLRLPDCGELQCVALWTDGGGFGSDWFVERVDVKAAPDARHYSATFGCWVKGGEEHAVTRPLTPLPDTSGAPPAAVAPPVVVVSAADDDVTPGHRSAPAAASDQQQAAAAAAEGQAVLNRQAVRAGAQALNEAQFRELLAAKMARAAAASATRLDVRGAQDVDEPRCDWQRHTMPYPPDPRYMVTYYHNVVTGQSTYDEPAEYRAWEAKCAAVYAGAVAARGAGSAGKQA